MSRYVFGGFSRCLFSVQKFDSDAERILAVILEREAQKWFRPARGQFKLFYRSGAEDLEYLPDFVAETDAQILMLEPKASNRMADPDVLAKRDVRASMVPAREPPRVDLWRQAVALPADSA